MYKLIGALAIAGSLLTTVSQAHGLKSKFFEEGGFTTEVEYLDTVYQELVSKYGEPPAPVMKRATKAVQVGERTTFWAMNVAANSPVQVEATLKHVGKHCYIYLELDQEHRMTQATAEMLAHRFDTEIYPTNHKFFGVENKPGVDFDEKITLLFLDIQDGWEPGKGYVGGYFSPVDQFPTSMWQFSNEREIFYMDIFPSDPTTKDYLGILAHEFQHMIHFNHDKREQLWLNEAMSQISFWVNDFGHAPQILSFLKSPDTQIDEFNNGIDDYGNVYLFMYYLATKVINDMEKSALIFRDIVASELKGMESVAHVLKQHGITRDLDEIIMDFLLANFINDPKVAQGQYAYDKTLPIKVQPTHLQSFASASGTVIETTVNQKAADFIHFSKKVVSEPMNATLVDKIKIYADYPATIRWNLNNGVLPPEVWRPAGSTVDGQYLVMPTTEVNGKHLIEVGPFVRGGLQVTGVNYEIVSEGAVVAGKIPVYSFQTKTIREPKQLSFHFDGDQKGLIGKQKKFTLHILKQDSSGNKTLEQVVLDKKNDATFTVDLTGLSDLTIIPVSTAGGEISYKLSITDSVIASRSGEQSLVELWLTDEKAFLDYLVNNPSSLEKFTREYSELSESFRQENSQSMRELMRQYQFRLLDSSAGEVLMQKTMEEMVEILGKADNSDSAHDNIKFLVKKAREGVHALSHLKIDPKFLEGQILDIYKLLELLKGFPHLPIPDGFAIKNYRVDQLNAILNDWEKTGGPSHHEVLRRMAIAESAVVKTYNDGLGMAEEASLSLLDLASFFLQSKSAITTLMNPLIEKGGIVGKAADALKKRIHAKLVQIFSKVVALASVKLPSPYNTIVPIASSVITTVWAKVFDLTLESDRKWMKPFAAKTLGKYALMSVPKIGIVDLGQPNVNLIATKALGMKVSGTTEDAQEDVRIHLFPIEEKINEIAIRSKKEREYAQLAKHITQLAGMTALLDPTAISKVIGLVSAVTGTGLLAHSVYESSSYLYSIPKRVGNIVDASFRPYEGDTVVNPDKDVFLDYPKSLVDLSSHRAQLLRASEDYSSLLKTALNMARSRELGAGKNIIIITDLAKADEEYSRLLKTEELALLGTGLNSVTQDMMLLAQESLERSSLEVELLLENHEESERLATSILNTISERQARLQAKNPVMDVLPIVSVNAETPMFSGNNFQVVLNIESLGEVGSNTIVVTAGDNLVLSQTEFVLEATTKSVTILGTKQNMDQDDLVSVQFHTKTGVLQYPVMFNL